MRSSAATTRGCTTSSQLRAELEHDKLAQYKAIYAKHGAGRTNLAYGYVLRPGA